MAGSGAVSGSSSLSGSAEEGSPLANMELQASSSSIGRLLGADDFFGKLPLGPAACRAVPSVFSNERPAGLTGTNLSGLIQGTLSPTGSFPSLFFGIASLYTGTNSLFGPRRGAAPPR